MKERVSATVEKETIKTIEVLVESGKFRNKSHVIEKAIELLKKEEAKNEKK